MRQKSLCLLKNEIKNKHCCVYTFNTLCETGQHIQQEKLQNNMKNAKGNFTCIIFVFAIKQLYTELHIVMSCAAV